MPSPNLEVQALLMAYALITCVNSLVYGFLFYFERSPFYRAGMLMWLSILVGALIQASFSQDGFVIAVGVSAFFFTSVYLVKILELTCEYRFPFSLYWGILIASLATSYAIYRLHGNFAQVSFPNAVGVAFPMLHACFKTIRNQVRSRLNPSGVFAFCGVILFYAFHILDYPFLRNVPTTAALGFTIALVILILFSIIIPVFIYKGSLNRVNDQLDHITSVISHEISSSLLEIEKANLAFRSSVIAGKEDEIPVRARDLVLAVENATKSVDSLKRKYGKPRVRVVSNRHESKG